ncbi:MAG TPA: ABC transporter permease [Gaiellaceae bacterium]
MKYSSVSARLGSVPQRLHLRLRPHTFLPGAALVLLVGGWEAVCVGFGFPSYFIPTPTLVAKTLWIDHAIILRNVVPTVLEASTGFVVGNVLAVALAIVFVHSAASRKTFYPLAIVLQSLPLVAIAPILIVALGTGFSSKVTMTAIISFFPTLVNTVRGLEAFDPSLSDLFQSVKASRWDVLRKLRLPNALPYIFVGLRITASASVIGAIIAEWIGANHGLGFLVINATYEFNTPLLWATLVASSLLVLAAFGLTALAERIAVPWQSAGKGDR